LSIEVGFERLAETEPCKSRRSDSSTKVAADLHTDTSTGRPCIVQDQEESLIEELLEHERLITETCLYEL
jgi:hypothetical protein